MELANKTIIVTGASSGIGAAAASLFASEGADVVLGARRGPELQAVVASIKSAEGARRFSPGMFGTPAMQPALSSTPSRLSESSTALSTMPALSAR